MDMYPKYKSPLGYQTGEGKIDSYGVNHKGFNTRDELEYQFARQKRENELIQQYNALGIDNNYPQYSTNFWGSSSNNYGFGTSNISENIKNKNNSLNQAIQYAQKTLADAASNVTHNPNYISDDELYKKMWNNIKEYENVIYHPYLDSKGYITIGGGSNINNLDDFMKVNFCIEGKPATSEQKLSSYNHLLNLSKQQDALGNYINRNRLANTFKNESDLRISEQVAYNMAQNHMINDLAHVRRQIINFDYLPNPLKEVLLDIQYNVKGGLSKQNWPNLFNAINNRDINEIVNNVHRKDVGRKRNDWAERMIQSISF